MQIITDKFATTIPDDRYVVIDKHYLVNPDTYEKIKRLEGNDFDAYMSNDLKLYRPLLRFEVSFLHATAESLVVESREQAFEKKTDIVMAESIAQAIALTKDRHGRHVDDEFEFVSIKKIAYDEKASYEQT